ncbi:uncharacterized protein JN550_003716 [Neoarthrinium moseri]|uniref:uncharacterized protein n=1 Tax=Neoarthrinium moseri TaxID=1658444 RepID=UPI001FDC9BF9|nr:uncharacterized protein JN550_003716 [Neoarthrinium moseri]KAI1872842.1 hypothetical protein JN550_003716 [Neoarthrinium moseri]
MKKNTGSHNQVAGLQATPKPKAAKIVRRWNEYWKDGQPENWQQLMRDLGFDNFEFKSKTQCRKVTCQEALAGKLRKVWVNIHDFLDAVKQGTRVHRFKSQHELSQYTLRSRKIYPRNQVEDGSPLRQLLAHIFNPKLQESKVGAKEVREMADMFAGITLTE